MQEESADNSRGAVDEVIEKKKMKDIAECLRDKGVKTPEVYFAGGIT
jgi:hypothetical protein